MRRFNFDHSERVLYNKADYPAYVRKGVLSAFPNYAAESHWHDDVEFILILSGEMFYNVNGEVVLLKEAEGIFVNARQLHFGYSNSKKECIFICLLLHPMLLCSSKSAEQDFINPITQNDNIPFYHFENINAWEKSILLDIQYIYDIQNDKLAELKIHKAFLDIWITLCENIVTIRQPDNFKNSNLSTLKNMISFINQYYKEKISLKEIASSGNVGKTSCCSIFKKYINKTPMEYVTEFRLGKSLELLRNTDITVLEISYEVGFSGASYFSEVFRKFYDCTPTEYKIAYSSKYQPPLA